MKELEEFEVSSGRSNVRSGSEGSVSRGGDKRPELDGSLCSVLSERKETRCTTDLVRVPMRFREGLNFRKLGVCSCGETGETNGGIKGDEILLGAR